jgi:hypothetical protein
VAEEATELLAGLGVPQADDGVERAGSDEPAVRADGDRRQAGVNRALVAKDEVLDPEVKRARPALDVPDPGRLVARARDEVPAVRGEVKRVDLLRVALEEVPDGPLADVPDPDLAVLGTRRKEAAVGREADGPDVEVALAGRALVLKDARLDTGRGVVDLDRPVAAGREPAAVVAELDAADDRFVRERVDETDVDLLARLGRPEDNPVGALLLELGPRRLRVDIG